MTERATPARKPVRPARAPLDRSRPGSGILTEAEVMLTMRPKRRSHMPSTTSWISSIGEIMFATSPAHASRSRSRKSRKGGPALLLTRTSTCGRRSEAHPALRVCGDGDDRQPSAPVWLRMSAPPLPARRICTSTGASGEAGGPVTRSWRSTTGRPLPGPSSGRTATSLFTGWAARPAGIRPLSRIMSVRSRRPVPDRVQLETGQAPRAVGVDGAGACPTPSREDGRWR